MRDQWHRRPDGSLDWDGLVGYTMMAMMLGAIIGIVGSVILDAIR